MLTEVTTHKKEHENIYSQSSSSGLALPETSGLDQGGDTGKKGPAVKVMKKKAENVDKVRRSAMLAVIQQAKEDTNEATKILAKLATVKAPLNMKLKHKDIAKLPEFTISAASAVLAELQAMESNARKVVKGSDQLQHSQLEANDLVKKAQMQQTLLDSMLVAVGMM